jgi:post-segregation antitoxin (ccd killing protein)
VQVYLPHDLYEELKRRGLPASELLQTALRAALERQDALDATDEYLAELREEVGEPNARDRAWAEAIVRRIREHRLDQAG